MREPAGDKEGRFTVRGYWQSLLDGPMESFHDRAREELDKEPAVSAGGEVLLSWWREIDAGRRTGMNGAEPVAYMDIDAWARLTGREPTPEEVSMIMSIERTVLNPGKRDDAE